MLWFAMELHYKEEVIDKTILRAQKAGHDPVVSTLIARVGYLLMHPYEFDEIYATMPQTAQGNVLHEPSFLYNLYILYLLYKHNKVLSMIYLCLISITTVYQLPDYVRDKHYIFHYYSGSFGFR